jgi:hypothetical protein
MIDELTPSHYETLKRWSDLFTATLSEPETDRQKVMAGAFQPDLILERLLAIRDQDPSAWDRLIDGTHTPLPPVRVAVSFYARCRNAWLAEHPGEKITVAGGAGAEQ